ncbi:MAG TPA: C1 family peptidase [Candidatus Acidoferrum sp.]|nr:C1 family peptidase [Candidatus Acidoferrum sp.]
MKHQPKSISSHVRPLLALGLVSALAAGNVTAYGQLTAGDIAALRERGRQEGWTFQVGESDATQLPLSQLCGAVEPPDWRENGAFDAGPKDLGVLPAAFDWRAQNGCTPIKNQGTCGTVGSCWAFATVGPLECNIRLRDGTVVDLSEQWLISCNQSGYSCQTGGWDAHMYHQATVGKCGHSGAVLEASYPYTATDGLCTCTNATNHVYHISSWAYIGGSRYTYPPVDTLKRAILDHGPITVCVVADSAFQAYKGGVFNACSSATNNHMVVLVGWDDNQNGGVWFVRNSWGTSWGENGYMRILYNCSLIGFAASYIVYPGANALQVSPCYGFDNQGLLGGPFSPGSMVYTLTNQGANVVFWEILNTPSWLDLSVPPAGFALAAGGSTTVTATVNSAACSLDPGFYRGTIDFVNDGNLHTNSLPVSLSVGCQTIYSFTLDIKPKWTMQGEWEFGQPTGGGAGIYGFPDPTSGYTGTNVFGVALNGDYSLTNVPSPWYYLTAGPYDLRGYTRTMLQFQRWLNARPPTFLGPANVSVDVSTNYPNPLVWSNLWTNQYLAGVYDAYWTNVQYNFPAWADNCRYVYFRWGYRVPDNYPCSGWNIDDIQVLGIPFPVITNQPASLTNGAGTTATFAVTAGGLGPLSYQWIKFGTNYLTDGGKISGSAAATLTISNVLGADRGNYSVLITNVAAGAVASSSATLTVLDPLITSPPGNCTNTVGTTATFTVTATGTTPLGYQWVKNATQYLSDGGNTSGSLTPTLTLTNLAASDAASYLVIVTNPAGSVTSSPAILTVQMPPTITAQPQSRTNYFGTTATFSVSATGTQPLGYQWRKFGTNLAVGTDTLLTLTDVGRRDDGLYSVLVTNILSSVLSSDAILLVQVPQRLGTPVLLTDGTCVLLSGDADGGLLSPSDLTNFAVYASTNLTDWVMLTNCPSLTSGQLEFIDLGCTQFPQRFYRILER